MRIDVFKLLDLYLRYKLAIILDLVIGPRGLFCPF